MSTFSSLVIYGQNIITPLAFIKDESEYQAKEYIIKEILNTPNKEIIDLEVSTLIGAMSGELTTVIYNCESLQKKGLLFVFWSDQFDEFGLRYKGYAFRHFEYAEAKVLLSDLEMVLEQKKSILSFDNDNFSKNAVYKWDDISFIFYKNDTFVNLVRVFWNNFDSEWSQANLKVTKRRFDNYFKNK